MLTVTISTHLAQLLGNTELCANNEICTPEDEKALIEWLKIKRQFRREAGVVGTHIPVKGNYVPGMGR